MTDCLPRSVFADADISFLRLTYALDNIYKVMKISLYARNKTATKIILLYLFKSWLGKNLKIQIFVYCIDIKHFIFDMFAFAIQPLFED